jgi:hypothetical protein
METITQPRAAIGESIPGYDYAGAVRPVVRLESWGPIAQRLEPIDPRDAAETGWSAAPEYRLHALQTGARLAVRVVVTGRKPVRWSGGYWCRGRVEFCGDGEPSTFAPCWLLVSTQWSG